MRIIDTHHHLWDLDRLYYPWLTDHIEPKSYGDYSAIRKTYDITDYLADCDTSDVVKSVHLAAGTMDLMAETEWLQAMSDDIDTSRGFPHAIVGGVNFNSDNVEEQFAQQCSHRNVRGLRQVLSGAVTAGAVDLSTTPGWYPSLALMPKYELSLDLQVHPSQLGTAIEIVDRNPDLLVIIDHCALVNYHTPELLEVWRRGVGELAARPNTRMKISAFMLNDLTFTVESIRPIVGTLTEAFGMDRCFFASNFPVDSLAYSFSELWSRYVGSVADLTEDEQDKLFYRNAAQTYRIAE